MIAKIMLATAMTLFSALAHANLLANGGAEAGSLSGWTAGGMSNPLVDDGSFDPGIDPRTGRFMFSGNRGERGTLTQRVTLDAIGQQRHLYVSFWEQGLDQDIPSDDAYVTLTYLGPGDIVIATQASPEVDSHDGIWTRYQGVFEVPQSAYAVDYTMHFVRHFGIDLDAFVDDNELTLVTSVPEPASALLTLAGLAALYRVRRRTA